MVVIYVVIVCSVILLIAIFIFARACYEYGFSKAVWMLLDVKNSQGWFWAHFLRRARKDKDADKKD